MFLLLTWLLPPPLSFPVSISSQVFHYLGKGISLHFVFSLVPDKVLGVAEVGDYQLSTSEIITDP